MDRLPNEVLEVIFKFCDAKTKLKLFLVSKRFNGIMSCSTQIMKSVGRNVAINFEKIDWLENVLCVENGCLEIEILLQSIRRYQQLKLVNLYGTTINYYQQKITRIVESFQHDLKELEIESSRIDFKYLKQISFAMSELKSLKLFLTCREFYFAPGNFEQNFNVLEFHGFMEHLKKLERLELDFFCHYNNYRDIFPVDVSQEINYQLKFLKISRIQINQNFLNFLRVQRKLVDLDISFALFVGDTTLNDLFEVLLDLKTLKTVNLQIYGITVVTDEFTEHKKSSNIESLSCMILTHTQQRENQSEFYLQKFVAALPKLRKFKFSTEYSEARNLSWLNNLKNLRELEMMDCKANVLSSLHLKSLENLKFHIGSSEEFETNLAKQWIKFFERHPNIKSLHLNGMLIEKRFLLHFCKLLEDLEILNVEIGDAETAETIIEFFRKLKFAKLLFLNDSNLDEIEKLFKRSSFNVNRKFQYLECMKVN